MNFDFCVFKVLQCIVLKMYCYISVLWLFLTVPWVGLLCVIVVIPDHTHLHFEITWDKKQLTTTFWQLCPVKNRLVLIWHHLFIWWIPLLYSIGLYVICNTFQWLSQNAEKKIRTSKGDYCIKQWFSKITSLLKMRTSLKGKKDFYW